MSNRVLVTGGSGFIGRRVVTNLLARPDVESVVVLSRRGDVSWPLPTKGGIATWSWWGTLTDAPCLRRMITYYRPGVIFHLGGIATVRENEAYPTAISETNVLGTHGLLAAALEGTTFVLASSSTVYGDNAHAGAFEEQPLTPNSVYGATKVSAEALVKAYADRLSTRIFRLVANVGGDATHGVLPDIIRKLRSPDAELVLLGDSPGSDKPYAYADDTAWFMVKAALDSQENHLVLNVGPDDGLNIEYMAKLVMSQMGIQKPIRWDAAANWRGDNRRVRINNRAAARYGWNKAVCLTSYAAVSEAILEYLTKE